MAFTRSKTSTMTAAQTLISMRYKSNEARIFTNWTNWYDAFVSEVQGEGYSPAASKREATSRWVSFCAKTLRCDESDIRKWLETVTISDY